MSLHGSITRNANLGVFFGYTAILVLALAIRLPLLREMGVWYDEVFSLVMSTMDGGEEYFRLQAVYHLFMRGWVALFGYSPIALKTPSLLFALLSFPCFIALTLQLTGSHRHAGVAALLLALASFHIYHSQEARPYTLLMLLFILSASLTAVLLKRRETPVALTALVLVDLLALFTHPYGLFLFGLHVPLLVRAGLRPKWPFGLMILIVGLYFLMAFGTEPIELQAQARYLRRPQLLGDVYNLWATLSYGGDRPYNSGLGFELDEPLLLRCRISAGILGTMFLLGLGLTLLEARRSRSLLPLIAPLWCIVPPLGALVFSTLVFPVFLPRYFLVVLPPFLLLTVTGTLFLADRLRLPLPLIVLVLAGLASPALSAVFGLTTVQAWQAIDTKLRQQAGDRALLFSPGVQFLNLIYYRDARFLVEDFPGDLEAYFVMLSTHQETMLSLYRPAERSLCSAKDLEAFSTSCELRGETLWLVLQKEWPGNDTWAALMQNLACDPEEKEIFFPDPGVTLVRCQADF
ncbi:MAG: hypothetical protein A2284_07715 [Deltaproteobacteria bacterium RIFOXYA12_FULL_61_11]|nr:MAG: hypothetical protein A2284_07715 [Deltaproteobacteria bacterium RIFOXYA12_FULL_61_11]